MKKNIDVIICTNKNLTVDDVNTKSGNWLHNFKK